MTDTSHFQGCELRERDELILNGGGIIGDQGVHGCKQLPVQLDAPRAATEEHAREPDRSSRNSEATRSGDVRAGTSGHCSTSAPVPAPFQASLTFCPSQNAAGVQILEIWTLRDTEPLSAPELSATVRVLQAAPETLGTRM